MGFQFRSMMSVGLAATLAITLLTGTSWSQGMTPADPTLNAAPAVPPENTSPAAQEHLKVQPVLPGSPVEKVVQAGLMNPFRDGKFHPEKPLSRAELATILNKTFELDKRQATTPSLHLKDVPQSYWARPAIDTIITRGIMEGYHDNGYFYPEQKVSRAEALAIFSQAYGVFQYDNATVNSILAQYPDSRQVPGWARKALATSLKYGFTETDPSEKIRPLQPMTRGEMAYTLSQYLERLHQSEQPSL